MSEEVNQYKIGSDVRCEDELCGKLVRVVLDPIARSVTHLVVEPRHHSVLARLVPIELADVNADGISLRCSSEEFDKLEHAEETEFLTGPGGSLGYDRDDVWFQPYYGLAMGPVGLGAGLAPGPLPMVHDRVPLGEVEVRRGEPVYATDGAIGSVQGLVIDASDHHVTHVLLQEGHLFGRKEVAIPIGAVSSVESGITLSITMDEVKALPAVEVNQHESN